MNIEMLKNNEALKTFIEIIKLPDEQFDNVFPVLMEQTKAVFDQPYIQKQIVDSLANFQSIDFDAETKDLEDTIKEIESSEELSQNKKDFLIAFLNKSKEATIALYQNPRMRVEVKIEKVDEAAQLPTYANPTDAGADIYAIEDCTINAGETKIIPTGIQVAIPAGYAIFLYPRSGMSVKTKMRIANSVGVIDHSYHKPIGVIFDNTGSEPYTIKKGDRIAQMVIMPVPMIKWVEGPVEQNERGGFGSTGS